MKKWQSPYFSCFFEQFFIKISLYLKSALNYASFESHIDHFQAKYFLVTCDKDEIRKHKNAPSQITACQIKKHL